MSAAIKTVEFSIYRYNPETDEKPYMQPYALEIEEGHDMMLLAALKKIKEMDPTLGFRFSCGEGVCGSDGMSVNGKNVLMCVNPVSKFKQPIEVRPLPSLPVIRDLIVDMSQFYAHYEKIEPYLQNSKPAPEKERLQSPADRAKLDGLYECILCGCCTTACPSFWWNPDKFLGPAALLQAYRFIADTRDDSTEKRLEQFEDAYSLFRCHGIMNCVDVCPKDLNPTQAIAHIREEMLKDHSDEKNEVLEMSTDAYKKLVDTTAVSNGGAYMESLYESFLEDKNSVDPKWRTYFENMQAGAHDVPHGPIQDKFLAWALAPAPSLQTGETLAPVSAATKQFEVDSLINGYRRYGHHKAKIDPLGMLKRDTPKQLTLSFHGLSNADLNETFQTPFSFKREATLKEIISLLEYMYTGPIGAQWSYVESLEEREWLQRRFEVADRKATLSPELRKRVYGQLTAAEGLERYLHNKYVGQKRSHWKVAKQ